MRDNTRHDRRKTTLTYKVRHFVAADEEPRHDDVMAAS